MPGQPSSSDFTRSPGVLDLPTGGGIIPAPTPELPAGIPGVGGGPPPAAAATGGGLSGFGPTPGTYRVSPTDPDAARMIAANPAGMYSMTNPTDAAPYLAALAAQGNPTTAAGVNTQRLNDPYFAALANAEKQGWTTPKAPVAQSSPTSPIDSMSPAPLVR